MFFLRRLILSAFVALPFKTADEKIYSMVVVISFFLLIIVFTQPFYNKYNNYAEIIFQCCLIVIGVGFICKFVISFGFIFRKQSFLRTLQDATVVWTFILRWVNDILDFPLRFHIRLFPTQLRKRKFCFQKLNSSHKSRPFLFNLRWKIRFCSGESRILLPFTW